MGIPYAEVIGDPIAHSKSPLIHKFWLERFAIDGDYRATLVAPGELADFLVQRQADLAWRGCNVTMPHKVAALALSCQPDAFVGATNALVPLEDRALLPLNTDYSAVFDLIGGSGLKPHRPVVVGSGGAARAALAALRDFYPEHVLLICRSQEKGATLLRHFGLAGSVAPLGTAPWRFDVIINASPLGMYGAPPLEIDLAAMTKGGIVLDMVYAPVETTLLRNARARHLRTIDGIDMLLAQARSSFELFFSATPSEEYDAELRALLTQ